MKRREHIVKSPNLTKILNKSHENKWVALSSDYKKVLAAGDTLAEIIKAAPGKDKVVLNTRPLFVPYAPLINPLR